MVKHKKSRVSREDRKAFFESEEWRRLRYLTFVRYGKCCQCCGERSLQAQYHVDHIQPISLRWDLRANQNNLQVLCSDCNKGKSNIDQTDWRPDIPIKKIAKPFRKRRPARGRYPKPKKQCMAERSMANWKPKVINISRILEEQRKLAEAPIENEDSSATIS